MIAHIKISLFIFRLFMVYIFLPAFLNVTVYYLGCFGGMMMYMNIDLFIVFAPRQDIRHIGKPGDNKNDNTYYNYYIDHKCLLRGIIALSILLIRHGLRPPSPYNYSNLNPYALFFSLNAELTSLLADLRRSAVFTL